MAVVKGENYAWIQCRKCGLGHARRPNGLCPRCGADTLGDPKVEEGPDAGPMPRGESVSGFAWDPALVRRAESKPPVPLRLPSLWVALYGTATAAAAVAFEEPILAAVSGLFAVMALLIRAVAAR